MIFFFGQRRASMIVKSGTSRYCRWELDSASAQAVLGCNASGTRTSKFHNNV